MAKKEFILVTTDTGCIVSTSHALNHDGYLRKWVVYNGKGQQMLYHRYVWQMVHGDIPDGYEVDHKCKNRACCNVEHLQLLKASEHRAKDNSMRYAGRKQSAYEYYLSNKQVTGEKLGAKFGVSWRTGCRWLKEWKQ